MPAGPGEQVLADPTYAARLEAHYYQVKGAVATLPTGPGSHSQARQWKARATGPVRGRGSGSDEVAEVSEHQYHEFQAVDRPLTAQEMAELRALSTRARITSIQFQNVYHWGGSKGDPPTLMEGYYDAFVYVANWGTHRFMLRLPRRLLAAQATRPYTVEGLWTFRQGAAADPGVHVGGRSLMLAPADARSRSCSRQPRNGPGCVAVRRPSGRPSSKRAGSGSRRLSGQVTLTGNAPDESPVERTTFHSHVPFSGGPAIRRGRPAQPGPGCSRSGARGGRSCETAPQP